MFRAVDHDDAKTMLLSSQVLRLARMKCEPTAAGQCRILTGFPWCAGSLSDHTPFVVVNAGGGAPEQRPAILGQGLNTLPIREDTPSLLSLLRVDTFLLGAAECNHKLNRRDGGGSPVRSRR
jgi:hypothetical protein